MVFQDSLPQFCEMYCFVHGEVMLPAEKNVHAISPVNSEIL